MAFCATKHDYREHDGAQRYMQAVEAGRMKNVDP